MKNPILLARALMDPTPHEILIGVGAEALAQAQDIAREKPEYFHTEERLQLQALK